MIGAQMIHRFLLLMAERQPPVITLTQNLPLMIYCIQNGIFFNLLLNPVTT